MMNLNNINFSYRVSNNQTELFSVNHTRYVVTINGIEFNYQCNAMQEPVLFDILECLLLDYECKNYNYTEFCSEFGYIYDDPETEILYEDIIQECNNIERAFTPAEIDALYDIINERY